MIGCRSSTLRMPVTRLIPPCTLRQGSPRVQVTASRAYRQAASCQLIQSSTRPWASSESRRTLSRRGMRPAASRCGGYGLPEASGAGGRSPAASRRSFALSSFIGETAYTRFVTPCVLPSGGETFLVQRHQRRGAAFDRRFVGQGARQDPGEVEARGLEFGLLERCGPRTGPRGNDAACPPVGQGDVAGIEQVVPGRGADLLRVGRGAPG